MQIFSRGQKGKLADAGLGERFSVWVNPAAGTMDIDIACFGVDAAGKLSDERYMVFYNQTAAPGNAVVLTSQGASNEFQINLSALPASIERLVFTATTNDGMMKCLGAGSLTLNQQLQFSFSGQDFAAEKAIILSEIYRKDSVWRFGAVGQGFNGGLSALLAHFGGEEAMPATESTPPAPPVSAPSPAPSASPKLSLAKVTLEKRGQTISLEKRSDSTSGFGKIRVNLNWSRRNATPPQQKSGLFGGLFSGGKPTQAAQEIDLDLGCYYEMQSGRKGLIQALGNSFGNYEQYPYVKLDVDDRSGSIAEGENIFVNGAHFDQFKRLIVFAFIYDGVVDWRATDGVVTLHVPNQPPVEVRLDHGDWQGMCAIASMENQNGNIVVTKLVEYFAEQGEISSHEMMDRRFNWGFRWKDGSKD